MSRGRMLHNGRNETHKCGNYCGAAAYNSRVVRIRQKHANRQADKRAWQKERWS